jgi:hypothetical protein
MKNLIGSNKLDHAALRTWGPAVVVSGIAWALCAANPARATDQLNRASTIACSSDNGQRQYCKADTQRGVRLIRQIRGSGCQPANWGYDARGVWVDRGCQAEFDLSGGAGERDGAVSGTRTIGVGTNISVRNNEAIDVHNSEGQAFSGAVYQDVLDDKGDVAIPKGSYAKLIVKSRSDEYLALDLESVEVNGLRYPVTTVADPTDGEQKGGLETAARTGDAVDGAKFGHAIAQVLTGGRAVKIPAESFLTFRLEQSLEMGGGQ